MSLHTVLSLLLLIVSWSSLLFLKPSAVRRFMPAALMVSILLTLLSEMSRTYSFWKYPTKLFPALVTDIPFVFGAFLSMTIWILALTFERPVLYFGVNLIADIILGYPISLLFEKLGYYELINYTHWQMVLVSFGLSVLVYVYQLWQDPIMKKDKVTSPFRKWTKDTMSQRQKAR